jgi:hypothetical protein
MPFSVERQKQGIDPFFGLLRFYFPPPAKVLDVTFGKGTSWRGGDILSQPLMSYLDPDIFGAELRNPDSLPSEAANFLVFRTDGFRAKGLDAQCNWGYLPFKDRSFNVGYWDPPFIFTYEQFLKGQVNPADYYASRHVGRGGKVLLMPDREFARVFTAGLIVKIQDTTYEGVYRAQHVDLINQGSDYFDLKDIRVFYYIRETPAQHIDHAIINCNFYLIFTRNAKDVEPEQPYKPRIKSKCYGKGCNNMGDKMDWFDVPIYLCPEHQKFIKEFMTYATY